MASCVLYTPPNYHKSQRILIAAQYSNTSITTKEYSEELAKGGKFAVVAAPLFECPQNNVALFETNAIAYYVGTDQLRGNGKEIPFVTQWINFTDAVILPAMAAILYPSLGVTQYNKGEGEKAKSILADVLSKINQHLASQTYLVGERITQADITVFCTLKQLLETHYQTNQFQLLYSHVHRWAVTIGNQPEVVKVTGSSIKMCEKPLAPFDAKKFAELHPKQQQQQQQQPQSKKKGKGESGKEADKPTPKKPEPKQEEDETPAEEYKDPFVSMPKGNWDMDEFKRTFSNKDIATIAIPYFWDKFEKDNYSIWRCTYDFPQELSRVFMSSNLIGGMFQRLDRLRKYAFGSMIIFGDNENSTIEGLWFWRGQGLAFSYHDSLSVDSESYTWTKLDPTTDETKTLVKEFFMQEGEFGGKKVAAGKIFK